MSSQKVFVQGLEGDTTYQYPLSSRFAPFPSTRQQAVCFLQLVIGAHHCSALHCCALQLSVDGVRGSFCSWSSRSLLSLGLLAGILIARE